MPGVQAHTHVSCIQSSPGLLPAFCVIIDGMTDPAILADDQIVTSDPMASGSLRPGNGSTFHTDLPVVNITIQLTNDEHISPPQLGKIDIIEEWSIHVEYYKV